MLSVKKELALADVFTEDSEKERTLNGFSDCELSDHDENKSQSEPEEEETKSRISRRSKRTTSKSSSGKQSFSLRVVLRSTSSTQQSTDDTAEDAKEEEKKTKKRGINRAGNTSRAKRMKQVTFKTEDEDDEDTEAAQPPAEEEPGSDSAEEETEAADSFLAKRQQNIMANKAMLAQLMADLQKMPGGAGLLKKQAGKQKTKGKSSRPPRSGGDSRKNPERASRRLTRSMGPSEDPAVQKEEGKEEELELSLEEELLEVRRAPQRRGTPRPNQGKPHVVRPVEDITEDELQLVAENMTEKVYNRVTGSTCHQCRQKTVDTKTCCRSEDCRGIQGQFCGPCLRNRYGEDVRKALLDPKSNSEPEEEETQSRISRRSKRTTSKSSSGKQSFSLRVVLRSTSSTQQSTDDTAEDAKEEEKKTKKRGINRAGNTSRAKRMKQVTFKTEDEDDEDTEAAQPPAEEEPGSDSAEEETEAADSFLAKRQQNIMANKAMLAQLMADLQKMPGGAGLLKKQAGKQKTKGKSSRPPRSGGDSRKNPERASRRLTRSMGASEDPAVQKEEGKEEELELSLEEELLEVRRAPQRRGTPRPNQGKPHVVRPVEDITEDELQLVAENMTEKVYNRVTGSTCHQCCQKTVDTKTCCRSEDCRGIQGQFCGPCLRNRYGEDVRKALLDPVRHTHTHQT